jgi:hypothetical protein
MAVEEDFVMMNVARAHFGVSPFLPLNNAAPQLRQRDA